MSTDARSLGRAPRRYSCKLAAQAALSPNGCKIGSGDLSSTAANAAASRTKPRVPPSTARRAAGSASGSATSRRPRKVGAGRPLARSDTASTLSRYASAAATTPRSGGSRHAPSSACGSACAGEAEQASTSEGSRSDEQRTAAASCVAKRSYCARRTRR